MYEIKYTNRHTGQKSTHHHAGSVGSARAWAETLARENGCKAVCTDRDPWNGSTKHIISVGDDGKGS